MSREEYESMDNGLVTSSRVQNGAGMLSRCNFNLAIDHDDVRGDIFIANKTKRLYVAVSVEAMVLSSSDALTQASSVTKDDELTFASSLK